MNNGNEKFTALLFEIVKNIKETDHIYKTQLYSKNITHPIPFFGNIEKAKIVTVGINPASSEFKVNRTWPQSVDLEYLIERLKHYFNYPGIPPHSWFDVWEKALNHISISYYSGDAAHIDLSARSTINIGEISEMELFENMIASDLREFFQLIYCCRNLRLLLIAGTVTKRYYINEFISKHCNQYGFKLVGDFKRKENPGRGKIYFHHLTGHDFDLPVFFCSVSPSARNSSLLVDRIRENKPKIIDLMK